MNNQDLTYFVDLFSLLLDGEISDEQYEKLKSLLKNNEDLRDYYYHLVDLEVLLRDSKAGCNESVDFIEWPVFWGALAQEERTAPSVRLPAKQVPAETVPFVIHPAREKKPVSKLSLATLITSTAALIFMIILIKFAPEPLPSVDVATLSGKSNVIWAGDSKDLEIGDRLYSQGYPLVFKKGALELEFDRGVKVIIEGPAKFTIDSENVITLSRGRLFANVSGSGKGFTVKTPSSVLVDLGTEFGVDVKNDGGSQLHVFRGKVRLHAGSNIIKGVPARELKTGQAAEVSAKTFRVSNIALKKNFRNTLLNPPFIFDDFELYAPGVLAPQGGWKRQLFTNDSPNVVTPGILGDKGLRLVENSGKLVFAKRPLLETYDPAAMTYPIYISVLMEWDGTGQTDDVFSFMRLALNDNVTRKGEDQNKIEAHFGFGKQYQLFAGNRRNNAYIRNMGSEDDIRPNTLYLCVMKITPISTKKCTISRGYFNVAGGSIPDESSLVYQSTMEVDPATLVDKATDQRYFLNNAGIALSSNSVLVDNFVVSDNWRNIQLSTRNKELSL